MPNERTKEKAHKMPCIMCSRKTLGRYKVSENERVPACGECMQLLDFGLRLSMRPTKMKNKGITWKKRKLSK